jgi:hypothetical protein
LLKENNILVILGEEPIITKDNIETAGIENPKNLSPSYYKPPENG